jgi:hypothetical protein
MEDGDDYICENEGRHGVWWTSKGSSEGSTITPEAGTRFQATPLGEHARQGSEYGMRLTGSGFGTDFNGDSAILGFTFVNDSSYDVTPIAVHPSGPRIRTAR